MELANYIHSVKIYPEYFQLLKDGIKNFEVRLNDRNYQVTQQIIFKEFDPATNSYTGNLLMREIKFVLYGGQFGIEPGYVVLELIKF